MIEYSVEDVEGSLMKKLQKIISLAVYNVIRGKNDISDLIIYIIFFEIHSFFYYIQWPQAKL